MFYHKTLLFLIGSPFAFWIVVVLLLQLSFLVEALHYNWGSQPSFFQTGVTQFVFGRSHHTPRWSGQWCHRCSSGALCYPGSHTSTSCFSSRAGSQDGGVWQAQRAAPDVKGLGLNHSLDATRSLARRVVFKAQWFGDWKYFLARQPFCITKNYFNEFLFFWKQSKKVHLNFIETKSFFFLFFFLRNKWITCGKKCLWFFGSEKLATFVCSLIGRFTVLWWLEIIKCRLA